MVAGGNTRRQKMLGKLHSARSVHRAETAGEVSAFGLATRNYPATFKAWTRHLVECPSA
jgi:hypothetical protein